MLLAFFLLPTAGMLHARSSGDQTVGDHRDQADSGLSSAAQQGRAIVEPNLEDIIPLAGELTRHLSRLKYDLGQISDESSVIKGYDTLKAEVDALADQLQQIKASGDRRWAQFMTLGQKLQELQSQAPEIGRPLSGYIRILADWKSEWMEKKLSWQNWQAQLLGKYTSPLLKAVFNSAEATIREALDRITPKLEALLILQSHETEVVTKIAILEAEMKNLVLSGRRDYVLSASAPLYAPEFFSQFRPELWHRMLVNVRSLSLPNRHYLAEHGWLFTAQTVLFLVVLLSILRNRQALLASTHWRFLAERPVAAAFFIVILSLLIINEYRSVPPVLRLTAALVGGVSFVRILRILIRERWQRQAALGIISLFMLSVILAAIEIPLPLYRLYVFLVSLLALYALVRWSGENSRKHGSGMSTWLFRGGYVLLGIILYTQLQGKDGLASYLFICSLASLALILTFVLFIYLIRGGVRWIFFSSPVWKLKLLRSEAPLLSRRVGTVVEVLVIGFILFPLLLKTWGVYGTVPEATGALLTPEFSIGSVKITVGLVLAATATLYGSFLLSWIVPKVVLDERFAGANLQRGVRISISRLIQYGLIFIGFLLTISVLGLDMTKLTIILSALGVGVGFGLQGLVNNFISGIVLLFERPVRVGDSIEVDGKWTEIKSIGLRSTIVQTLELAEIIIPNGDLISKGVTNWTLSNRQVRVAVSVGVAYGSDVARVMETLLASAGENDQVLRSPTPQVLFLQFGESSLDFELRIWIADTSNRLLVASDLHREIDRRFREADIEIAFPQRDLHLRSVDSSVAVPAVDAGG